MIYQYAESFISGVYNLKPDYFKDGRGSITKTFHKESFEELGLDCAWGESLITENFKQGVIRGFHFQKPPYCQAKTIYCVSGSIRDAVLDLRKGSPTYGKIDIFELDNKGRNILYVPRGVSNCYAILEDDTTIAYHLTSKYMKEYDSGVRWDSLEVDFGIETPIISDKDKKLPRFDEFQSPFEYMGNY